MMYLTSCMRNLLIFLYYIGCWQLLGAQIPKTYIYKTVNGIQLSLDVYTPRTPPRSGPAYPTIVFFFGGGMGKWK